jgi:hypothetical protein
VESAAWVVVVVVGTRVQVEVGVGTFLTNLMTQGVIWSPLNMNAQEGKVAFSIFIVNWIF